MASCLAKIILGQIQGTEEMHRFLPFDVDDHGDMWFVSGNAAYADPGDLSHDEVENEHFDLQVIKSDSEVTSVGVYANLKLSSEQKSEIRAALNEEGESQPIARFSSFDRDRRDVHIPILLYGGVINSAEAACCFGELVLKDALPSSYRQFQPLGAQEVNGQWRVQSTFKIGGQRRRPEFELVFNRSNAKVISLTVPSH